MEATEGAPAPVEARSSPQEPQAVAGVPRLFVGQVPTDKSEADLAPIFASFGSVEKVTLVRGPEGRSKGCAMVQFAKWAEAEAAMEAVNGTSPLEGGKGRPLVVHFANPRRAGGGGAGGGGAAEAAIAPRKVFVGQIPKTADEAEVLAVFAPYGEVESVNILKSKGLHAGCAFVQFKRWSSCEESIAALHEQLVMPGCEHPLVVKFADAKRSDNPALKAGRGVGPTALGLMPGLGMPGPMHSGPYIGSPHAPHPLLGPGSGYPSGPELAAMASGGLAGLCPPLHHPHHPHQLSLVGPGLLHSTSTPHLAVPTPLAMASGTANGLGSLGGSSENLLDSSTDGDGPAGLAPLASSIGSGLAFADGSMASLRLGSSASAGSLQAMSAGVHLPGMHAAYGLPPHGHHDGAALHHAALMAGPQQMMMAAAAAAAQVGPPHGRPIKLGRGVSDPSAYHHKLFVGQVPFEANEHDLWALFSPVGEVLELAILRSQGRSKGCAFLTYATRQQAVTAINAFNGRPVAHNKRLVVKFADQKAALAPQQQQAAVEAPAAEAAVPAAPAVPEPEPVAVA